MALKIDVLDVANAIDALESAVRAVRERLSVDDLIKLSTAAAVGRTGLCTCMSNRLVNIGHCVQAWLWWTVAGKLHRHQRQPRIAEVYVGACQNMQR